MALNPRQIKFCEEYIISLNATDAALKAGYSKKTAYAIGNENLKKPEIKSFIQDLAQQARNERIATAEEILVYLSETVRDTSESRRERTKAAELLGKRFGLFEDKGNQSKSNKPEVNIVIKNCGDSSNE